MNTAPIGIIDSGFGGLSVYERIAELLPKEKYIYLGDHAHIPYSGKTVSYIHTRIKKLITFLLSKQVKLIVIACNTATVAGIDRYRKQFPTIPILGVVPVIKTAAELSGKKSFCVLATDFTARSVYQKKLIETFASGYRVHNIGGADLVDFVERGIIDGRQVRARIKKLLTPRILGEIDVIALGCTHYPFLKPAIRAIVGEDIQLLDSGSAVARHVKRILEHNHALAANKRKTTVFFTTARKRSLSTIASVLLKRTVSLYYEKI